MTVQTDQQAPLTANPVLSDDANASVEPVSEYQQRIEQRRIELQRSESHDQSISVFRGIIFVVGLLLLALAATQADVSYWWLVLPFMAFIVLVILHNRVSQIQDLSKRSIAFYERGLERLKDCWTGVGVTGERYLAAKHLYADDLDVFGNGSLFQLISSARTRIGEDTLANWLLNPAPVDTVLLRQQSVDGLRFHLNLREKLAMLSAEVHDDLDQNRLVDFSHQTPVAIAPQRRILAFFLAFLAVGSIVGWAVLNTGLAPIMVVLVAESIFLFTFRDSIRAAAKSVDEANSGLDILAQVLRLIESEQFETPHLSQLRSTLDTNGLPPSVRIARFRNLSQNLQSCLQNQFLAPFALLLCLPIHLIHAIEKWHQQVGPTIPEWLRAVGEFEALGALAGYAYEHPNDPFPEIVNDRLLFDAKGVGHPLLPIAACIRNDVRFDDQLQLIMISGSNMSGKSTLLRSIGTNVALALAGGPVRADQLTLSRLAIGSAMRVHDSLQQGASLFYAAISRIKSVVELTDGDIPLLFLLDEILQGTNSHDRRVGAEGIIRQLIERGAIGVVTTHDLALTDIANSFDKRAVNMHFEDHLVDGKMTFDYQLRPGVVERSNALELMRMVGLAVDVDVDKPKAT